MSTVPTAAEVEALRVAAIAADDAWEAARSATVNADAAYLEAKVARAANVNTRRRLDEAEADKESADAARSAAWDTSDDAIRTARAAIEIRDAAIATEIELLAGYHAACRVVNEARRAHESDTA
jgi:hypothetical protein